MELHPKDRAALERLVSDLRALHGDALLAVALTGEAAGEGYLPRRSPLTCVAVLAEVTPAALRATRGRVRAWAWRRLATPLLMDPHYIESSLDVFPLEFLGILEQHRLLHGESDPFADLPIDVAHLRLEVEEQLRGKLLHLWEAYLETRGARRALRRLLLETPPGFELILRGLLRLRAEPGAEPGAGAERAPSDPEEVVRAVERRFEVALPALRRLEAVRRGRGGLARGDLEALFEGYLTDVRRLVRVVDAL